MFEHIPWSKYKKVFVTGDLNLTPEQMIQYKTSSENTHNMDWDRLVPEDGSSTLVNRMLFKQDDMNTIYEDIVKIAKECPFLNITVEFTHDYTAIDDEDIYADSDGIARDQDICKMVISNGKVTIR